MEKIESKEDNKKDSIKIIEKTKQEDIENINIEIKEKLEMENNKI